LTPAELGRNPAAPTTDEWGSRKTPSGDDTLDETTHCQEVTYDDCPPAGRNAGPTEAPAENPGNLYPLVVEGLAELGVSDSASITRTLLVANRQLVGQRFHSPLGQAIWRAEPSVLEFYDSEGQLRKTIRLGQADPARDAA
jgi:hypothetical protein